MEENRFMRAYLEHKREKEDAYNRLYSVPNNYNTSHKKITYLPKPASVNTINTNNPPVFSFNSNYHFPELAKTLNNSSFANIPKSPIKLPEPAPQKEMIVNPIVIPDTHRIMTLMYVKDGKLETKDVFEDGTEVSKNGTLTIKKPKYTSWASVLKSESIETIVYDLK
jgi:hypothetical protein